MKLQFHFSTDRWPNLQINSWLRLFLIIMNVFSLKSGALIVGIHPYVLIQSFLIFYYSLGGKRDGCMGKPWLAGWCCKRRSVKNKSLTWCIKSTRNCGCLICDGLSFLVSTKQDQPACLEPHHILTQIRLILTALELLCQWTNTHTHTLRSHAAGWL